MYLVKITDLITQDFDNPEINKIIKIAFNRALKLPLHERPKFYKLQTPVFWGSAIKFDTGINTLSR